MKNDRYRALHGEPMVWTKHENMAAHGVCPIDKDERVILVWSDGFTNEARAGDLNWARAKHYNGGVEPIPVTHYSTCEPRFPELAKEVEAKAAGSQVIGEFLEWAQSQGLVLAEWEGPDSLCVSQWGADRSGIIADYFGIDIKKAEAERQQLLAEFVASQQEAAQ